MNKPFDLERALAGDPVVTREGETILIVFDSGLDVEYPLSAWIEGRIEPYGFRRNGRYTSNDEEMSNFDLFMVPKKRTAWVNLPVGHKTYETEDDAKYGSKSRDTDYMVIAVPVEIEE